ncbi:acyl-CoA thioesterase [Nesterenkonia natronophila]|uniref:Acyl-CoA thioesterase n=1 Tax=Nesterenkonia natronophila TaxID=2174932 RepID=A0A3A4F3Z0_9MICC|nr:thioesterase family protein [Nesterenkonia natronophila]RJN31200.1 acyl-CoA thioesterase [Nesterenkonia natronophila]
MTSLVVPIELRWGDQDSYGHINNVAVLRILEEARARAFWSPPGRPGGTGVFPALEPSQQVWALVADFQLRYRQQLPYQREPVNVEMSIPRVGGASFVIDYAVTLSAAESSPRVSAQSTLVMVDRDSGAPQRLSPEVRRRLREYAPDLSA